MPVGLRDLSRQDVKFAKIVAGGSATTEIVPLTVAEKAAGKKICVVSYYAASSGNSTWVWKSFDGDSTYTDLSGTMTVKGSSSSGLSCDWNPDGHFETLAGETLVVTCGSNAVGGHLSYFLYE
jgi:hypothetical protein|tara:strand:- start:11530 stop:11898 length:369 start_codon:yes stop_codon:yes gene_type:complete